jgi:hypothetical protein
VTAANDRPQRNTAVDGWSHISDVLFHLSLDLRTSRDDQADPMNVVAAWLWHEIRDRQLRRLAARAAVERALATEPPQLDFRP